jgi:isopenicillin N synthase-like dioxygenase
MNQIFMRYCLHFLFYLIFIVFYAHSLENEDILSPPVIDISPLITGNNLVLSDTIISEIGEAARNWGFFTVINHGIDDSLTNTLLILSRNFFQSDPQVLNNIRRSENNSRGYADLEYTKQKIDAKRVFDMGHTPYPELDSTHPLNYVMDGYNRWPPGEDFKSFREVVIQYYNECVQLSYLLLNALVQSFRVNKLHLLDSSTDIFINDKMNSILAQFHNHTSLMRLNYYPPAEYTNTELTNRCDATNSHECTNQIFGVSRHTDAGGLTVLLQDHVSALEVYTGTKEEFGDGEWVPVHPIPGGLTINIGDMLQVWSNDWFKAAEHRVRATNPLSHGGSPRYSVPFFYNPSYDAIIEPFLTPHDPHPHYSPIRWGDFRLERFLGDYADRGHEIQIEDFRIEANTNVTN